VVLGECTAMGTSDGRGIWPRARNGGPQTAKFECENKVAKRFGGQKELEIDCAHSVSGSFGSFPAGQRGFLELAAYKGRCRLARRDDNPN
jgi:hypothetical protein